MLEDNEWGLTGVVVKSGEVEVYDINSENGLDKIIPLVIYYFSEKGLPPSCTQHRQIDKDRAIEGFRLLVVRKVMVTYWEVCVLIQHYH